MTNPERPPKTNVSGYDDARKSRMSRKSRKSREQSALRFELTGPAVLFIAGAIVALMGLVAAHLAGGG